jgi:hypothetical protein
MRKYQMVGAVFFAAFSVGNNPVVLMLVGRISWDEAISAF